MDTKEVLALRSRRQEDYQKDMDAIERVLRMLSEGAPVKVNGRSEESIVERPPIASDTISPSKAVRESMEFVPESFTINDVRAFLKERYPTVDTSAAVLSPALRRIASDGIINTERVGSGSTPTIYIKVARQRTNL